ncbi:MAG TPA: head GIN domain-containing protein [Longimicrobiales bacterium]|nr:head GIN domain-containing protein [Longimicrobiales bacterium]
MEKTWLVAASVLVLGGCTDLLSGNVIHGSGAYVEEVRAPSRFSGISNSTVARVEVLQGPRERLRIRGEENLLPHIRTRVENGMLRIYTDANVTLRPNEPIVVELDAVVLARIVSSSSGDINAPLVDAGRIEVISSGAGAVYLQRLLADSLIVTSSGSGDVLSSGDVRSVRITHSGSGAVDTRELLASEVDALLSGSGHVTVRARDWIYAVVSGAGSLRYYGNPVVQQMVTGSGRVTRAGG